MSNNCKSTLKIFSIKLFYLDCLSFFTLKDESCNPTYATLTRGSQPEVFCKRGVLKNLATFRGKHLCWSLFFNKVAGLRHAALVKKRLQHRCFSVNFAKFLRTPFFTERLRWLLLIVITTQNRQNLY